MLKQNEMKQKPVSLESNLLLYLLIQRTREDYQGGIGLWGTSLVGRMKQEDLE